MSTQRNSLIAKAVRFALIGGAFASVATGVAFAAEDDEKEERITVLGSRIKRTDAETSQPITVVTREDIAKTGLNSLHEVLNNLSVSDGGGLSTTTTQTNGSDGSQNISLRGLGANRTLILVDGKRWITDLDATVDLSTIPLAIIERIDVLKDGASAIYGSDAIAGVINLVTRRDYDGAQFGMYYGRTTQNDGDRTAFDLTIGATGEKSNAVLSVSHSTQDPIMAGQREQSNWPYFGCKELSRHPEWTASPGVSTVAFLGSFCGSGSPQGGSFAVPGLGGRRTLGRGQDGRDASDFVRLNDSHRYNFAPVNYLQQPAKRTNIFASGTFNITDDMTAYAKLSYTKRRSDQQLAEVPLTMAVSGSQGPQWRIPIAADNVFNPFDATINTSNFRMTAVGPRKPSYDYDVYSTQLGLEGSFEIGSNNFDWDVFGQYNDGQFDAKGENYVNLFNLRNALGSSFRDGTGTLTCGTPSAPIRGGCVPFNVFGGADLGLDAGIISQAEYDAMINYVQYTQVATAGNTSHNYGATLSGDIVELPGGMMGFAVGLEHRLDSGFSQPDTLVASGGSSDNFSEPTKGMIEIDDMFVEIVAPILKGIPAVEELEITFASRNSDYQASGLAGLESVDRNLGSPTTNKFGVRWKIMDDLLLRYSKGDTFRAPSVNDLFQGGQEGFPQASDPCSAGNWARLNPAYDPETNPTPALSAPQLRCVEIAGATATHGGAGGGGYADTRTQLRSLSGGNPFTLKAEQGENTSYGVVYSPNWLEGFDISVDWWKVDLDDAITSFGAVQILSGCYVDGSQPQFCDFVERSADGLIATIRTAGFNANSMYSAGIDMSVHYKLSTGLGDFRFAWDVTKNTSTEINDVDYVGKYTGSPNFEYRSQLASNWQYSDYSVTWTMRYMSSLEEPCWIDCFVKSGFNDEYVSTDDEGNPLHLNETGSVTYHDIQLGWNTPGNGKIAVGARNVFGKEPPILQYNSFAHSFDAAYDIPGGAYWYATYRQDF